jgi:N4-gp56 family major capsid protein
MAINYAEKYAGKVDERMSLKEMTNIGLNTDYEWDGVNAIYVYNVDTVPLNNYVMEGANRYGTPVELGDAKTKYELTTDKGFAFTIDERNAKSQNGAKEAGRALAREIDEVVVPFKDMQRLKVWSDTATANDQVITVALTKSNAYATLLDAQEKLTDEKVPLTNRIFYCNSKYYKLLKQDDSFVKASDIAQNMLVKGQVGEIDGVKIVVLPSSYFETGVNAILVYTKSTVSPSKLRKYTVHKDAPGINGTLTEGRVMLDTFVLTAKKKGIVAIKEA